MFGIRQSRRIDCDQRMGVARCRLLHPGLSARAPPPDAHRIRFRRLPKKGVSLVRSSFGHLGVQNFGSPKHHALDSPPPVIRIHWCSGGDLRFRHCDRPFGAWGRAVTGCLIKGWFTETPSLEYPKKAPTRSNKGQQNVRSCTHLSWAGKSGVRFVRSTRGVSSANCSKYPQIVFIRCFRQVWALLVEPSKPTCSLEGANSWLCPSMQPRPHQKQTYA